MSQTPPTAEQILEAAEDVLRRFGPARTTVADVARALGVSQRAVARHFPTKAALREAVVERWLQRARQPLAAAAATVAPAPDRLRAVLVTLVDTKWGQALEDPEIFAALAELAEESRRPAAEHAAFVVALLAVVVAEGVARGEMESDDPEETARAIFDATGRFHLPAHRDEWPLPDTRAAFDAVWDVIRGGLVPRQRGG